MNVNNKKENEISKGPFEWIMGEPKTEPTYPISPDIRIQGTGDSIGCELVDENSELMNITRKYTRCPESRYMPGNVGVKLVSEGAVVDNNKKKCQFSISKSKLWTKK